MDDKNLKTTCPQCGFEFNISEAISLKMQEKYRDDLNKNIARIKEEYSQKQIALSRQAEELEKKEKEQDRILREKLGQEKSKQLASLKEEMKEEFEDQLKALNDENEKRKEQIKELNRAKIENEQLKRRMDEQKDALKLEYEEQLTKQLKEEAGKIRETEAEKIRMKMRERDEIINSLKDQLDTMKRKAEQGSVQLQGEVQELELEELLKNFFPLDVIEPVPKGVRGADVIQEVRNPSGTLCGKIVYESKRTKNFNSEWVDKLKADAVSVKADVLVIVSETLPEQIDRIGVVDGVWVCSFMDVKGLSLLMRESLIKLSAVTASQENKGGKMQMLYDYLTGSEFKLQIEAIVDGFSNLEDSYRKERAQMERIWKRREKELARILMNTNHFIGSIQGIAGNSLPELRTPDDSLELPE